MLDRYLDAGGNFLDTADTYDDGLSEETLAPWLAGHRDDVVLATKVRFPVSDPGGQGLDPDRIRAACDASLRRLGVDEIDLYQVHAPDPGVPLEATLEALDGLVRAGKVKALGVSNFPAWLLAWAVALQDRHGWSPFVSLQPQYSLIERSIETEILPFCRAAGLGVLPWGPLGAGFLTGRYSRDEPPPAGSRMAEAGDDLRGGAGAARDRAQLQGRRRGARDRRGQGRDGLPGRARLAARHRRGDGADHRAAHVRAARRPAGGGRRLAQRRRVRAARRAHRAATELSGSHAAGAERDRRRRAAAPWPRARRAGARGHPRSTTRRRRRARAGCRGGCGRARRRR